MKNSNLNDFLNGLPKVELHNHLEGAVPIKALWKLMEKYNGLDDIRNINDLKNRFQYKNFSHFLENWVWINQFLREYEDFTFLSKEVANHLKSQNIKYAELFYTPGRHVEKKLKPQKVTEAIIAGFKCYEDDIVLNLICDLSRDSGPEDGIKIFEQINEVKELGVIGIGIGGSEHLYPPKPFKELYEMARNNNLHTTAHAGEASGSMSIWSAINDLKVERIGHGTRAIEDNNLVHYLYENQIPIEMCPISNLKTGVVHHFKEHPIKPFFERGLLVFVNTDDPTLFNNSLKDEYASLIGELDFELNDIKQLIQNGIKSAWCHDDKKTELFDCLNEYFLKKSE